MYKYYKMLSIFSCLSSRIVSKNKVYWLLYVFVFVWILFFLRSFTKKELKKVGLKYNQLVMGIGRGTRYLLNDADPDSPKTKRAVGVNLVRNKGLKGKF